MRRHGQGVEANLGAGGQITEGFARGRRDLEYLLVKWGAAAGPGQGTMCSDLQKTKRGKCPTEALKATYGVHLQLCGSRAGGPMWVSATEHLISLCHYHLLQKSSMTALV